MLSRVWAVCTTKRGKTRRENRSEMGGKWLLLRSHAVSKPTLSVKRWGGWGLAGNEDLFLFSKLLIMFFQRKSFFFPACVWRLRSLPLPQTLHELSLFFQRLLELRAKAKSFQIFLWKSLASCFFEVVALRVFGKKFMSLVRGYWNCKDHRATSTVVIICLLAVWISDLLPRMNGFSSVQFVPITQNATNSQRCNLLQLCNQFFKCF